MPTLLTDPRSGGVKKSSGVNVLPVITKTWNEVRDDSTETSYLLATYADGSKTDITLYKKGSGGLEECCKQLNDDLLFFGGVRLSSGRFMHIYYCGINTSLIFKGRAAMHKNGVFNVLEGCDGEIPEIWNGMTERDLNLGHHTNCNQRDSNERCSSYAKRCNPGVKNLEAIGSESHSNENVISNFPGSLKYDTLKTLQDTTSVGIDPRKKEMYLSDEEFEQVFRTSKIMFLKFPLWKQKKMKQDVGLF